MLKKGIGQEQDYTTKQWLVTTISEQATNFCKMDFHHKADFRVGHRILSHSECSVLLKNAIFFSVLFLSNWQLMKPKRMFCSFPFFCKERKRTREHFIPLQKNAECSAPFQNIDRKIYIDKYIYRYM